MWLQSKNENEKKKLNEQKSFGKKENEWTKCCDKVEVEVDMATKKNGEEKLIIENSVDIVFILMRYKIS